MKKMVLMMVLMIAGSGCISHNTLSTYSFDKDGEKIPEKRYVYFSIGTKGGKFAVTGDKVAVETKDVMDDAKDIFKEAAKVVASGLEGAGNAL